MKRIILIALIIVSIFTFGACGKADAKNVKSEPSASSVVVMEQEVSSEVETLEPSEEEEQETAELTPEEVSEVWKNSVILETEMYLDGYFTLEECVEWLNTCIKCMDNEQFTEDVELLIFCLENKAFVLAALDECAIKGENGEIIYGLTYEEYIAYSLEEIELKDYTVIK